MTPTLFAARDALPPEGAASLMAFIFLYLQVRGIDAIVRLDFQYSKLLLPKQRPAHFWV
jgi:hypothetical protein